MPHTAKAGRRPPDPRHLDEVEALSLARGERMTPIRREIISALARMKEPVGAYRILAKINEKRIRRLSAMSLYRTLDFLIQLGVVIKIESRNAYKLCLAEHRNHGHLIIVCDSCGDTKEVQDRKAEQGLRKLVGKYGHKIGHHAIELRGVCAECEP